MTEAEHVPALSKEVLLKTEQITAVSEQQFPSSNIYSKHMKQKKKYYIWSIFEQQLTLIRH